MEYFSDATQMVLLYFLTTKKKENLKMYLICIYESFDIGCNFKTKTLYLSHSNT